MPMGCLFVCLFVCLFGIQADEDSRILAEATLFSKQGGVFVYFGQLIENCRSGP
jgi:hypothetical protein